MKEMLLMKTSAWTPIRFWEFILINVPDMEDEMLKKGFVHTGENYVFNDHEYNYLKARINMPVNFGSFSSSFVEAHKQSAHFWAIIVSYKTGNSIHEGYHSIYSTKEKAQDILTKYLSYRYSDTKHFLRPIYPRMIDTAQMAERNGAGGLWLKDSNGGIHVDQSMPDAFVVYLNNKQINTVYFGSNMTLSEVAQSLIEHDGYDPRIKVYRRKLGDESTYP